MTRISSERSIPTPPSPPKEGQTLAVQRVAPHEGPSPFQRILGGLGGQLERGERTMAKVTQAQGKELGAQDLLALQADVYRYSEAVDLSAKLVDRASNGVKTIIQGQ